ncbi:Site-specific recombinase XerD [Fodinibius roseus]|uniref:Site-specific recombinase XerD n=1 Tax=Fodinibius roseus TaxID=1194090 RepID=A0A1M5I9K9_9BACT|nr:site-specific integrase [Fodinibius roseus]SHG24550.1 Site-specific recombinase XerD [Fodinibius roseus]
MYRNISLSFLLRTNKTRKDGTAPIYMRIYLEGQRAELSTGRTIVPKRWDSNKQRVRGTKNDAKAINYHLDTLHTKAMQVHSDLIAEGVKITVKNIKQRLKGNKQEQKKFLDVVAEHVTLVESLVGKDYAKSTYKKYLTIKKHLTKFINFKYGNLDLKITEVDLAFIRELEHYLKTKKKCSHNTTLKYLSHVKKITSWAQEKGWLKQDPFEGYKKKYRKKDPVFLEHGELKKIEEKEFSIDRLERIKDIFLFSCYTGLSFSDAENLSKDHIYEDESGDKWLSTSRTKTKVSANIPLMPKAQAIIKKYEEHPQIEETGRLLPFISNQKTNAYLQEIADLCKINKHLTHHVARHTFATSMLEQGVPAETVQKMMGHKDLRSTMHYAKVTKRKIKQDIKDIKAFSATG